MFTPEEREKLRAIAFVLGPDNTKDSTRITYGRQPDDTLCLAQMVMKPSVIGFDLPELESQLALSVSELHLIRRAILASLAPAPEHQP